MLTALNLAYKSRGILAAALEIRALNALLGDSEEALFRRVEASASDGDIESIRRDQPPEPSPAGQDYAQTQRLLSSLQPAFQFLHLFGRLYLDICFPSCLSDTSVSS